MTHDEIAAKVAEIFVSRAYVHVVTPGHYPYGDVDMVEMNSDSLKAALTLALAQFAREYGLKPDDKPQ
jgi:hypothetical protein